MNYILTNCNNIYITEKCCHKDYRQCNCYDCLSSSFYGSIDSYNCLKKLCYYTMNYGPSYCSEIYHLLNQAKLIEHSDKNPINILSLGCGFGSDLIALKKYFQNNNINRALNYLGLDKEPLWNNIRLPSMYKYFKVHDVLTGFDLSNQDIIFINKLYSTLLSIKKNKCFLKILKKEVLNMKEGSILIFNDINHIDKGRDNFDYEMTRCFSDVKRYFFNINGAYKGNYIEITGTQNICTIPNTLSVSPKTDVFKTVFFIYYK